MAIEDYVEALKIGEKTYRRAISKGEYPYLPALDDIVSRDRIEAEVNIGLVEIPMKNIVGTKTKGRTSSFAADFMPILHYETEFAIKWGLLSTSLLDDGLRDPIKAYEYLNHFYVLEGNKRVSVMKFFGATSIPGYVIRVVPKRSNSLENRLYYEFMKFYELSKLQSLGFTKPGSYKKLQGIIGKAPDEKWTDDERLDFKSFYTRFEKAYMNKKGDKGPESVGDAALIYLDIYPYSISKDHLPNEMLSNLNKSWEEFIAGAEEDAISISMTPIADEKKNIISKIFASDAPKGTYKIAFIEDKYIEKSAWTYAHELGRQHLVQKYGDRIETKVYQAENPLDVISSRLVFEEAIKDGNKLIFSTTPKLTRVCLETAIDHPDVKILNCSMNMPHPLIRSYYGRMYEAKFLIGALAGLMADGPEIGYVADYPICGMTASINAFARGVKMTNPDAKVVLEWSKIAGHDAYAKLRERGITLISDKDTIVPGNPSRVYGLYKVKDGSEAGPEAQVENIAVSLWHWGKFYELLIHSIFSGTWKKYDTEGSGKALNYWWGMSAGVVDIITSRSLPYDTAALINLLKRCICTGEFHPFAGKLMDNQGKLRHDSDVKMASEDIILMDWLLDNVEGSIPETDSLIEDARQVVIFQGITE